MIYHKFIIGLILLIGLTNQPGTADDTTTHPLTTGFVKVYTNYTVENPNSDMELAYYKPYSIFSIDGELIRYISRSLSVPQKIRLPEGEYTIIAALKGIEKDTIQVTIEAGKISVIQ